MHKSVQLLDEWLRERATTHSLARTSIRNYRSCLTTWLRHAPTEPVKWRRGHVLSWLESLVAAGTRRSYLSRLDTWCRWLVERKVIAKLFTATVPRVKTHQGLPRPYSTDEVSQILAACGSTRDRAIVLVALHTGLRRAELCGLDLTDIDWQHHDLRVRHGKGDRERVVPIGPEALTAIDRYLDDWPASSGPLFRTFTTGRRLAANSLGATITQALYDSGVKSRAFDGRDVHAFRHTAATEILRVSGQPHVVQKVLGHQSIQTTMIYARAEISTEVREAVEGIRYT